MIIKKDTTAAITAFTDISSPNTSDFFSIAKIIARKSIQGSRNSKNPRRFMLPSMISIGDIPADSATAMIKTFFLLLSYAIFCHVIICYT